MIKAKPARTTEQTRTNVRREAMLIGEVDGRDRAALPATAWRGTARDAEVGSHSPWPNSGVEPVFSSARAARLLMPSNELTQSRQMPVAKSEPRPNEAITKTLCCIAASSSKN